MENEELREIAVQPVGQTGSTMVYDREGRIHFHSDQDIQGEYLESLWSGNENLQEILESSFRGESAGYYEVEDANGDIRRRYMYCTSVEGTSLFLAASTFIDEFSRAAERTESAIAEAVEATTEQIDRQMDLAQWTFIVIILCMVAIIATLASFMARTITDPIHALTRGSEVIAEGDLDYRIKVNTGDEIEHLATQFNAMTAALKESLSNMEHKVAERTKRERQRAEQLRTINEISRNISSLMSLDELLPYVATLLRATFNYYNVNIFLFEPESGKLILKEICLSSYRGVIPLEVPLEMGEEGIVAWVAMSGEPLLVNDVSKEPRFQFIEELSATQSELAVPIRIGERVLGVLDIESNVLDAFSETDLFTARTLADQLAIAI
jgi:nitrate/nitrite-specific signal transduction histidine kinase